MENSAGSVLKDPLCISDLIKDGSHFQISTNFEDDILGDDFLDELNINLSDDDDDGVDPRQFVSPWEKSFDELRGLMTKVNDYMYKRVIKKGDPSSGKPTDKTRVVIEYNAYWEKEKEPFDSSFFRGDVHVFHCGNGEVLEGLENAVCTMVKGEEAQFVISYQLLFREMGCPPRIKPRADGLFIIKLRNFSEVGNAAALEAVPKEDRDKFPVVIEKIREVHLKGIDCFKHRKYVAAARCFHKAVNGLEFCHLSNDQEQDEQKVFLIKLYTNLAVCYNNLNQPKKTCSMINELRRISKIGENCKALFHEGRALLMLGEFERAKSLLTKAQTLEPTNINIARELKVLAEKYETYHKNERNIWKKAIGILNSAHSQEEQQEQHIQEFKSGLEKYIEDFKNNDQTSELTLPQGLSTDELAVIAKITETMNLKMNIQDINDNKTYTIRKK